MNESPLSEGVREADIIADIRKIATEAQSAGKLGRYANWGLVWWKTDRRAHDWIHANFQGAKRVLAANGIHMMRWSSLSGDDDDSLDFAVKLLT